MKTGDFEVKTGDFEVKTGDFEVKMGDLGDEVFWGEKGGFWVKMDFGVKLKDFGHGGILG